MSELEKAAEKYAKETVDQSDFITVEMGVEYCKTDFMAGAEWYKEKSKAPEMLEMLKHLLSLKQIKDIDGKTPYYLEEMPKAWEKAKQLIQSETTL